MSHAGPRSGAATWPRSSARRTSSTTGCSRATPSSTSCLALLLEDVVRHYAAADLSNGALVAVPNRHQLVWRAVDSPSVIPSLNGMIAFTQLGHDEGAGPVSRDVFWHHDGSWEQLTEMRGDEQVVNVGPELHAVLERLL